MSEGIKKEVDVLREALKSDPGYYYGWQANIAMAFYDEYRKAESERTFGEIDVHKVANQAAKNFLNLLIRE